MSGARWECKELGLAIVADGDDLVITKGRETHRAKLKRATGSIGTLYRHPAGGELVLPPGWQVTTSPLGLQLVPPDLAYTAHGPAEIYTVVTQPIAGVTRAEDPRVLLYVDGALRKLLPTLGAPGSPVACGPGVAIRWSAQHLEQGGDALALALLQILDGAVAGIVAIGEKPRVEAREAVLQQIFLSLKAGQKQRDPALVGTWHHWSPQARRTLLLAIDGTAIEKAHEGGARTGTWSGGAGTSLIQWADGHATVGPYQIAGAAPQRRMLLAGLEWSEGPSAY